MAGDQVRIRTPEDKQWSEPATAASDAENPRSYMVKTPKETESIFNLFQVNKQTKLRSRYSFLHLKQKVNRPLQSKKLSRVPTKSNQQLLYKNGQRSKLELPRDLTLSELLFPLSGYC